MNGSHEEMTELIAAYALGAVPQEEVGRIRAHILTCDECMADADAFEDVIAKLGYVVDEAPLPSGFADRVMAQVASERPGAATAPTPRRRWGWLPVLAAAALVIALAVVSASLIGLNNDLSKNRAVISALLHNENGFTLAGSTGAVGRIVPTADGPVFAVAGLSPAPKDHTYQLWLLEGGKATSAGVFDVSEGVEFVDVEGGLEGADGAAVTLEPAGGSPQPTTQPLLAS